MKNTLEITKSFYTKWKPCAEKAQWLRGQDTISTVILIGRLLKENKLDWTNWLMARCLSRKNRIRYAIHAAEQVVCIYESRYPNYPEPRKAIQAAKAVLKNNNKKTRAKAKAASDVAAVVFMVADMMLDEVCATAAYTAMGAAGAACHAYVTRAADAVDAVYTAAREADTVGIVNYGLTLLKKQSK